MPANREVITLHFGQAGIQIGNAIWETMITEHGILCNGTKDLSNVFARNYENSVNTLFHLAPSGQYVPRSLIVDTEPTVVDEIRTGFYRNLFHPEMLISGIEDAANNYARGYYSIGKKMLTHLLDKVRYIIESCNNFKGFLSITGSGGGTGTGLYTLFTERIMLEYSGRFCIGSLILPGKKLSDSVVEPYNTILRIGQSASSTDLNILLDNESLYKICSTKLETYKPTFNNINKILAPIFSTITAPFRFEGLMMADLSEMATNLVPYPKINFPTLSYSPFTSTQNSDHTLLTSQRLTDDVFHFDNSLLSLDIKKHKIMSSFLVYRGSHLKSSITAVLDKMKKTDAFRWVDWCPTGFKVAQTTCPSIQNFPTVQPDKCVLMLCNHSGIISSFEQIIAKFHKLYKKKCFVHWYIGEGMEYDEMTNAHCIVLQLRDIYEDACQLEKTAIDQALSAERSVCEKIRSKENTSHLDPKTISEITESKKSEEHLIVKTSAEPTKASMMYRRIDMDTKPTKSISGDKDKEKKNEVIIDNTSETEVSSVKKAKEKTSEYVFSDKAKEVLLENLTSLSPELKQRMLGFTNID